MKKTILFILLLSYQIQAYAGMTIVVQAPNFTPLAEPLYLAGTMNNWTPDSAAFQLQYIGNYQYSITIVQPANGAMQFKITRGTWATVETTTSGADIANRTATYQNNSTLNITVQNWHDLGSGGTHTLSGNCGIMTNAFPMPQLSNATRRVWLYLPPDYYSNPTAQYPVLYMHDGQNLFDDATSFSGEWGIDEAMQAMTGTQRSIVVGIDNGGGSRIDEYSPWINAQYGGGKGDEYMDWLVNNLKPYIDNNYRTLADRNNTGILGSSMGGLISFYGAMQYQNVFSKAGIFSPSFWFSNQVIPFAQSKGKQASLKFYFVCGANESSTMGSDMQNVVNTLVSLGFNSSTEVRAVVKADGQHSEWFWKREFPAAYAWLFANLVGTNNVLNDAIKYEQNSRAIAINSNTILIHNIQVFNLLGQKIKDISIENNTAQIPTSEWANGAYILQITTDAGSTAKKIVVVN